MHVCMKHKIWPPSIDMVTMGGGEGGCCAKFTYAPKQFAEIKSAILSVHTAHMNTIQYRWKLRFQWQNNRSLWPMLSNRFGISSEKQFCKWIDSQRCSSEYNRFSWLMRHTQCGVLRCCTNINLIWHMLRRFFPFQYIELFHLWWILSHSIHFLTRLKTVCKNVLYRMEVNRHYMLNRQPLRCAIMTSNSRSKRHKLRRIYLTFMPNFLL